MEVLLHPHHFKNYNHHFHIHFRNFLIFYADKGYSDKVFRVSNFCLNPLSVFIKVSEGFTCGCKYLFTGRSTSQEKLVSPTCLPVRSYRHFGCRFLGSLFAFCRSTFYNSLLRLSWNACFLSWVGICQSCWIGWIWLIFCVL